MVQIGKVKLGEKPTVCAVLSGEVRDGELTKLREHEIRLTELRVDYLRNSGVETPKRLISRVRRQGLSVILTIRSHREGGKRFIPERRRLELFRALAPFADAVDVELKSSICRPVIRVAQKLRKKAIVSFHDFQKTPSRSYLDGCLKKAKRLGADIFKVAAMAKRKEHVVRLMDFVVDHRGQYVIGISMGKVGAVSRVAFPFLGSLLTYGFLGKQSAPGQASVFELAKAIRFET